MSNKRIEERVQAGIALLDQHDPEWPWKVDPVKIRMETAGQCVLGQRFGLYNSGVRAIGIPLSAARYFGFRADGACGYPVLNRLWREAIAKKRREPAAVERAETADLVRK